MLWEDNKFVVTPLNATKTRKPHLATNKAGIVPILGLDEQLCRPLPP